VSISPKFVELHANQAIRQEQFAREDVVTVSGFTCKGH
jgi:hypothetical protein